MYKGKTIGVVVPVYNESGLIGRVIDTMPDIVDRIYVVDDGSTDGTWDELTAHIEARREAGDPPGALETRWVPIQHEQNSGVGGAILTGYRRALDDDIDAMAVMAGDAQMDPDLLPKMLDPVVDGDVEYAKASRLLRREDWRGMPPFRLFGNLVLTFLTQVASGYWEMTDPQNGYTVISKRALREIDLDSLYQDYGFANDLLVKLNAADMPIADVETPSVYDEEDSHIDLKTFIPKTSMLLLRNFLWRLRRKHLSTDRQPFVALYALGVSGVLLVGLVALLTAAGVSTDNTIDPADSVVMLVGSVLAVLFAMVRDRSANGGLLTRIYSDAEE
jgi:glycosyltransferase involved in cell wall biosynthesis